MDWQCLTWQQKETYQYVDGTPFVFSDFYNRLLITGHASNINDARGKCISLNVTNSGWQYSDCNTPLPFVCKVKPNGKFLYHLS